MICFLLFRSVLGDYGRGLLNTRKTGFYEDIGDIGIRPFLVTNDNRRIKNTFDEDCNLFKYLFYPQLYPDYFGSDRTISKSGQNCLFS